MKKNTYLFFCPFILLSIIFIGGCSASSNQSYITKNINGAEKSLSVIQAGYTARKIIFPVNQNQKTKYNSKVYEIKPFTLSFALPKGWSIKAAKPQSEEKNKPQYFNGNIYSVMNVFNGNNLVGAIGYNTYKPYKGAEDNPKAIFSEIALGSGYRFEIADYYKPVKATGTSITAITNVYYSSAFLKGYGINSGEKRNWGILSHNKKLLVYVAAEFDKKTVSKVKISTIAKSFKIL